MKKNQKLSFTKLRQQLETLPIDELKSVIGGCAAHPTQCFLSDNLAGVYYLDLAATNVQALGYNYSGHDIEGILCGSIPGGVTDPTLGWSQDHYADFDRLLNEAFGTPFQGYATGPEPYQPENAQLEFMLDLNSISNWDMSPPGVYMSLNLEGNYEFFDSNTNTTTTVPSDDILKYQANMYFKNVKGYDPGLY